MLAPGLVLEWADVWYTASGAGSATPLRSTRSAETPLKYAVVWYAFGDQLSSAAAAPPTLIRATVSAVVRPDVRHLTVVGSPSLSFSYPTGDSTCTSWAGLSVACGVLPVCPRLTRPPLGAGSARW